MRVLLKFSGKSETIENISVDDKCFPLVAGVHPYPASSRDTSPLAHESALWFKTLAVDSVYIDCDRRLIYWAPVVNDVDPEVVSLRKKPRESQYDDFIPSNARPLCEDVSLYDFDASLKEIMGKCCGAARKFFKHFLSPNEFNKILANLLHVYILKCIRFSQEDMYCLSRTRCLIEERLTKAEGDIVLKADGIEKLETCLKTLKDSILHRESLDSERYLRTCNRDFLKVFLEKIEAELENLNLELEAEQSKVNWAKQHKEDADKILFLQGKRNGLFEQIEQLIKVREAIKNVISRKEKTRKKMKKSNVVESCFHNIFIEVERRLKIEYQILDRLCNDKVNISAAREATMSTILELNNNNRDSDRATRFDPEDFVDYSLDDRKKVEKSDIWLTFQERVNLVLGNNSSAPCQIHEQGCRRLAALIDVALSEYKMSLDGKDTHPPLLEEPGPHLSYSDDDVQLRKKKVKGSSYGNVGRSMVVVDNKVNEFRDFELVQPVRPVSAVISTDDININFSRNHFPAEISSGKRYSSEQSLTSHALSDNLSLNTVESECNSKVSTIMGGEQHSRRDRESETITSQLALMTLMKAVENLKEQIQVHFREVVESLINNLVKGSDDQNSVQEQQELLWKSYERSFCEMLLPQLTKLYSAGLVQGTKKAYQELCKTSLHELLSGDKIINLFFGQRDSRTSSFIPIPTDMSSGNISMAKTMSNLSLDVRQCDIDDLYSLANADSCDLRKRFKLDDMEEEEKHEDGGASSSGSSGSADVQCNDRASFSASPVLTDASFSEDFVDRRHSITTNEDETALNSQSWKRLSNRESVIQVLDPVLTPFRNQVRKCLDAKCFLDKVRYITKAIEGLNRDISTLYGPDHQSACDDIITMLILALSNMSEDIFVGLYVNLRLLMDMLPPFLSGTLWDYNMVSLYASYDYLFTRNVCEKVVQRYAGSFKVKAR